MNEYIDSDFLLANQKNPMTPSTNGNPLTDLGILAVIHKSLGGGSNRILDRLDLGVQSLENLNYNGIWNKKMRSDDEVTHDDIIGLVCYSKLTGHKYHHDIHRFGSTHNWIMSNTGKVYFDAMSKPWNIAYYKLAADEPISFLEKKSLVLYFIIQSLFKGNSNEQRMTLMISKCVTGKSKVLDCAIKYWNKSMNFRWGGISRMLEDYYKMPHPFSVYYKE